MCSPVDPGICFSAGRHRKTSKPRLVAKLVTIACDCNHRPFSLSESTLNLLVGFAEGGNIMVVAGTTPNMGRMAHDFSKNPMLVYWEMTQACGLACKHCRAGADGASAGIQPRREPPVSDTLGWLGGALAARDPRRRRSAQPQRHLPAD